MKQFNLLIFCLFLLATLLGSVEAQAQCQARLGVSLFREHNAVQGVPVKHIIKNSPAMIAGLKPGDIIIRVNSTGVSTNDELKGSMTDMGHGSAITIKYLREGKLSATTAILKCLKEEYQEDCQTIWIFEELSATETLATEMKVSGNSVKGITSDSAIINAVDVFPNPSKGLFNVSFHIANPANTYVRILDLNGREIQKYDLGRYSGTFVKAVDISKNAAMGIYVVQIISGETIVNKQVVIQR